MMSQNASTTIAGVIGYVKCWVRMHIHTPFAGTCSMWSRGRRWFQQSETAVFVIRVYSVDYKDGSLHLVIIEESVCFVLIVPIFWFLDWQKDTILNWTFASMPLI